MAGERAGERVLGAVADGGGDRADRLVGVAQPLGGEVHAPARQVVRRRLADQVGEAAGQRRPRHADLAGQRRDRPGLAGPLVDARASRRRPRVAQREQPPVGRLVLHAQPRAHHVDQHHVDQPAHRGPRAGRAAAELGARAAAACRRRRRRRPGIRPGRAGPAAAATSAGARPRGRSRTTAQRKRVPAPGPWISTSPSAVRRASFSTRSSDRVRPSTYDTSSCGVFVGSRTTSPGISRSGACPDRSQQPPAIDRMEHGAGHSGRRPRPTARGRSAGP